MDDTEQSDEERWEAIRHSSMDDLAQEIGRMCVYWSELERSVSVFVYVMLKIEDRISSNVVAGALDFRAKLHVALPLAFDRKPSDQWYKDVEQTINIIDNNLRPERNRIIHDTWVSLPGLDKALRMRIQGKVIRTQSRTQEIRLSDIRRFSAKDVGLLYVNMIKARESIDSLSFDYQRQSASLGISLPPIPPQNPDQD